MVHSYLRNGFCNIDTEHYKLYENEVALYDYLGIPYTIDDDKESMMEKRFGRSVNREELKPSMRRYHKSHITDYTTLEYCRYMTVKEKGLEKHLKPYKYDWNELICELVYLECPDIEEVIKELNKFHYKINQIGIGGSFERELKLTGRIDIMLDKNYTIDERETILEVYSNYGIDLRLTDLDITDTSRKALTRWMLEDVIMSRLTTEEIKLYRKQSNQFRETRNKDKGVSL